MDLLTLQETMQRLGKSDATIRRMIRKKQLSAQKIDGRYYFHLSDVIKHLPNPSSNDQAIRDLLDRVGSLEREVDDLKQQLQQMTIRATINEKPPVEMRQANTLVPQIKASQPHFVAIPTLPEGTLHFHDWLIAHGLKDQRRKIVGYLENRRNGLRYEAFPKANRPSELDRYLTPEQQEDLMRWLKAYHPEVFEQ